MTDTVNLGLPCIEGSQAQKHVTHNDALRILDTLVQLAVLDRDLTAPPGSPAEGQRWIIKTGATGAWAGHVNAIAAWQDGAWQFSTPQSGWCAFVIDESTLLVWNGTAWSDFFSTMTSIQNLALLGVGTTADTTNRLSAKLNNTLFVAKTVAEGGDGNLRYKLSKESAAKTLSFLLQDNYSGRAEIGLTGDDDFHFKVSPDGTAWTEGIKIAAATGKVSFPVTGGPREMLTANRTYYVRTDGNDSNTGLANTSGGAFLTIQKAVDTIYSALDLAGYTATVQVGAGTYTGNVTITGQAVGQKSRTSIRLTGDTTTPSNVVWSTTGSDCLDLFDGAMAAVGGFKMTASGAGTKLISLARGSQILIDGAMEYGSAASWQLQSDGFSYFQITANYTISGGAGAHMLASSGGTMLFTSLTVPLTGTPAFSTAFAAASYGGVITTAGMTYSGSATGPRYWAVGNGIINTNGGGATYFPGNSAGTTATGGQYA